jgi:hypothetical protein
MLVYSRNNVEWIAAVERIFNPKKIHPDDALKEKIEERWDDAISLFVLQDLRRSTFRSGRRTHLWVEMSCMIAYFLTPLPFLCRLIDFENLSNADVFNFGPKFFLQFTSNATCIFYPQYSSLNPLKVTETPIYDHEKANGESFVVGEWLLSSFCFGSRLLRFFPTSVTETGRWTEIQS